MLGKPLACAANCCSSLRAAQVPVVGCSVFPGTERLKCCFGYLSSEYNFVVLFVMDCTLGDDPMRWLQNTAAMFGC